MNLPPKPPRFVLPVGGAKVGSIARPVADGTLDLIGRAANGRAAIGPRLGLRSNTRTLASLSRQDSRLPGGRPAVTPEGSLTDLELRIGSLAPDGEVA